MLNRFFFNGFAYNILYYNIFQFLYFYLITMSVKQTFKNSTLEVIVQSIIQVFKKSSQYKNLCINVNKVDN